jgi:hypothetical protein
MDRKEHKHSKQEQEQEQEQVPARLVEALFAVLASSSEGDALWARLDAADRRNFRQAFRAARDLSHSLCRTSRLRLGNFATAQAISRLHNKLRNAQELHILDGWASVEYHTISEITDLLVAYLDRLDPHALASVERVTLQLGSACTMAALTLEPLLSQAKLQAALRRLSARFGQRLCQLRVECLWTLRVAAPCFDSITSVRFSSLVGQQPGGLGRCIHEACARASGRMLSLLHALGMPTVRHVELEGCLTGWEDVAGLALLFPNLVSLSASGLSILGFENLFEEDAGAARYPQLPGVRTFTHTRRDRWMLSAAELAVLATAFPGLEAAVLSARFENCDPAGPPLAAASEAPDVSLRHNASFSSLTHCHNALRLNRLDAAAPRLLAASAAGARLLAGRRILMERLAPACLPHLDAPFAGADVEVVVKYAPPHAGDASEALARLLHNFPRLRKLTVSLVVPRRPLDDPADMAKALPGSVEALCTLAAWPALAAGSSHVDVVFAVPRRGDADTLAAIEALIRQHVCPPRALGTYQVRAAPWPAVHGFPAEVPDDHWVPGVPAPEVPGLPAPGPGELGWAPVLI